MKETWVPSLGWEDPLEKEMATHSSILAWKFPWTEEPGGYSPRGGVESDTTEWLSARTLCCPRATLSVVGWLLHSCQVAPEGKALMLGKAAGKGGKGQQSR